MKKVKIIPGTQEALEAGCTCPVIDNEYGRGYMGQSGIYVFRGDCPVHQDSFPKPELPVFKDLGDSLEQEEGEHRLLGYFPERIPRPP